MSVSRLTHEECSRGLTLIEVLAATVLLATMALACIPLLQSAGAFAHSPSTPTEADLSIELRTLADAIAAHPDLAGCKELKELLATEGVKDVAWPDREDLGLKPHDGPIGLPVQLRILRSPTSHRDDTKPAAHAWMTLQCGESCIVRWIKLPPPSAEAMP